MSGGPLPDQPANLNSPAPLFVSSTDRDMHSCGAWKLAHPSGLSRVTSTPRVCRWSLPTSCRHSEHLLASLPLAAAALSRCRGSSVIWRVQGFLLDMGWGGFSASEVRAVKVSSAMASVLTDQSLCTSAPAPSLGFCNLLLFVFLVLGLPCPLKCELMRVATCFVCFRDNVEWEVSRRR